MTTSLFPWTIISKSPLIVVYGNNRCISGYIQSSKSILDRRYIININILEWQIHPIYDVSNISVDADEPGSLLSTRMYSLSKTHSPSKIHPYLWYIHCPRCIHCIRCIYYLKYTSIYDISTVRNAFIIWDIFVFMMYLLSQIYLLFGIHLLSKTHLYL